MSRRIRVAAELYWLVAWKSINCVIETKTKASMCLLALCEECS